jgi:hypothetical protein
MASAASAIARRARAEQQVAQMQTGIVLQRTGSGALVSPELSADGRPVAAPRVASRVALTARASGADMRVRLAVFRAIKEDMRQIITHMTRLHGDEVLRHKATPADLAQSAKLRCVFEGVDDLMPADGLSPRDFTLALIERGYERARVLAMLPAEDDAASPPAGSGGGGGGVPLPVQPGEFDLEAHCAALVGTQVTLAEHGDCQVLSVCAGGHVKVALQPSGRSSFVPMAAFGPDAAVAEPHSIDLSAAQPVRLPANGTPARCLEPAEIEDWLADERSVRWEFQAGTLWSKFDEETTETLESSLGGCSEAALALADGESLMSLTSMRAVNANALHLVNDLSTYMQVPVDEADFVEVLPAAGCQIICTDDEEQAVAAELSAVLAARGWCVEVAAPGASPRPGDICLELEAARGWPLGDARFGTSAYALAVVKDAPLTIRAATPDGLRRGCALLTRSIGPGAHHQHAGVRMQRSICHGGALAELVAPPPAAAAAAAAAVTSNPMPQTATEQGDGTSTTTTRLAARLPPCFYMDCPIHTGYHRIWYGRTECWSLESFLEMAAAAGAFQPSHSRRVRRLVCHSRSDHRMLQICRPGAGTTAACEYATAIESNGDTVKVQLAGHSDTVSFPMNHLQIPATLDTGLDWSTVTYALRSASGKVGVLFLQFPGSRVVVAKLTDSPASELAGGELARIFDVRAPNISALSAEHGVGATIVKQLRRLRAEGRFEGKWESPSKFAFVLLQELQAGRTLKELCHEEAAATPDSTWALDTFGPAGNPSQRGVIGLHALGRLVACDVLTHNSDRFFLPGLFQNFSRCGNVANIMFDDESDEPIAIDNAFSAYALDHADNAVRFQHYCVNVSELTARVISRLQDVDAGLTPQMRPHPSLKGVCDFFVSGQGKSGDASYVPGLEHDLGQRGLIELERGFISVVEQIRSWERIDDVFVELCDSTRRSLGLPEGSGAFDIHRVEPAFFAAIATSMVDAEPAACTDNVDDHAFWERPPQQRNQAAATTLLMAGAGGPSEEWHIKRPALGVGKPFCRVGDRLAAQVETDRGVGRTQWCIGVVGSFDQLAERATARFALPPPPPRARGSSRVGRTKECANVCCGSGGNADDGTQQPQQQQGDDDDDDEEEEDPRFVQLSIGLDDLHAVRWALRRTDDYDGGGGDGGGGGGDDEASCAGETAECSPAPPVLAPPPTVAATPAVTAPEFGGSVAGAEQAMPWDRFARATARLEGNLANAIAVSGRA